MGGLLLHYSIKTKRKDSFLANISYVVQRKTKVISSKMLVGMYCRAPSSAETSLPNWGSAVLQSKFAPAVFDFTLLRGNKIRHGHTAQ